MAYCGLFFSLLALLTLPEVLQSISERLEVSQNLLVLDRLLLGGIGWPAGAGARTTVTRHGD